tara:strand:- start:416 stop:1015 length:600 start_codon:yes stop_codon:yes gene_type:complete
MLTIVIASYRYGHLAAHCIESILSQTKAPEHILFVDDGVGDCKHLPKIYPQVEYVFRENNLGTVENFQDALMRVNTEFTMFIGADNWFRSDTVEILTNEPADIITYDIMCTGELLETHPINHERKVWGDTYWCREGGHHGSMMYRTSIGQRVGYSRNQGSKNTEEDLVLFDGMRRLGATVKYIDKALLYYRRHRENFIK